MYATSNMFARLMPLSDCRGIQSLGRLFSANNLKRGVYQLDWAKTHHLH